MVDSPATSDAHDRGARDQRSAVLAILHEAHDEVEAGLGGGAQDQRQAEDVAQVELEIEEAHQPDRPHQAERQRQAAPAVSRGRGAASAKVSALTTTIA